MNIYQKLKLSMLSTNESIIRDAILKDPFQFASLTPAKISDEYHISRATLYRLCDKLELKGFHDLKVRLLSDYDSYQDSVKAFDFDYPVQSGASVHQTALKLQEDYTLSMQMTVNLINYNVLPSVAMLMKKASVIDIYASAGNIYFAENFAFQMRETGKNVFVPEEEYLQRLTAAGADSEHFAIVISFGGRGLLAEHVCRTLRNNHCRFLLISSKQAENIIAFSDYQLYMPESEHHSDKISSFSTRFSLLYLLDLLYTAYFNLDYDENIRKKNEYYRQISAKK